MKSGFKMALAAGVLLAASLAAGPVLAGGTPGKAGRQPRHSSPAPTAEPAPPLSVEVKLVNLQKNSSGGVASLSLEAESTLPMDEVRITLKAPPGVVFSDGAQERNWTVSLAAGGTLALPFDLLASQDGKYILSGEALGSREGRPVHRGFAYKLLVGVQEEKPKVKDGAIEYPGVPGGGN